MNARVGNGYAFAGLACCEQKKNQLKTRESVRAKLLVVVISRFFFVVIDEWTHASETEMQLTLDYKNS